MKLPKEDTDKLIQVWTRVAELVQIDIKIMSDKGMDRVAIWKSLFASLVEIGELATAIKVETGIIKHKKLSENSLGEIADVYICIAMLAVADKAKVINSVKKNRIFSRKMGKSNAF